MLNSSHLSLVISDQPVEFLAFQTQEVLPRLQDATLGCNGAGGVDVVSRNHTYCDACALTLSDSFRHLRKKQTSKVSRT